MDELEEWKLCDSFTVIQAALLIIGEDPAIYQDMIQGLPSNEKPKRFEAVFSALKNAINRGTLKAELSYYDSQYDHYIAYSADFATRFRSIPPPWSGAKRHGVPVESATPDRSVATLDF